ncbi:MAG TPA: DUF4175 family protein [Candidatus Krumholzibacteria bacterium]|nr:DUF4175 family protein [Candidatus Krumholzibacteria bacterium]
MSEAPRKPSGNDALRGYLRSILLRTAALHVGAGLVSVLAAGAWLLLGIVVWAAVVREPSLAAATWVARSYAAILIALVGFFIVWPLVRMPRIDQLASEIERRQDLKELVRAGFEFSRDDRASQRYAPELVREVIRQAVEQLSGLKVRFLFLGRRQLVLVPVALGGLIVLLGITLFNPRLVTEAGRRVVSPRDVAAIPHAPNIHGEPGNVTVLAGSDVTVGGLDLGKTDMPVEISYNLSADFWKTEPTQLVRRDPAASLAFDRYDYTFKDIRNTTQYFFQAGNYKSETYTITVVHEPILTDVRVTLTPPAYTNEPATTLTDNAGNVQALEGTRVKVEARSNNPLRTAWVQFDAKDREPVEHTGRDLSFEFTALTDGQYRVLLEDSLGFSTRDPLAYTVEVFQDHPPTVDVIEPGDDTAMPRTQQVDIGFVSADDYGVARAALYHRKTGDSDFQRVAVPLGEQRNRKEIAVAYRWDLTGMTLFPGNSIEYYVEVADNNVVTGPGIARSKVFHITMPTIGELYDTAREDEGKRAEDLQTAIEDSKQLSEQLEKISREYLKTEKMEWSQKKELDRAIEQQKSVQDKLSSVKESLDKTLQDLSDNEMTSQEIGKKMEEIRDLMNEINSSELQKYMEELRKAMEKMNPEDIRQALENMEINTEEMLQRLERTASLLKQLQKEQKMEEMVRKAQDLMEKQADLNQETDSASAEDKQKMDELAERQEELAKQASEMQKSAEDLAKEMEDQKVSDQLSQMSQEMQSKDGPQKDMQKAAQSLQQQQQQQASQQQQDALKKMVSLFKRAQQAQQSMQSNQNMQMAANLQKFAKQTLDLSFRQETLAGSLKNGSTGAEEEPASMENVAEQQLSYLQATQKVADEIMKIGMLTMSVPPDLIQALGDAINRMQSSMLFLEQDKPFMSTAHASNAVESLNKATIEMLRSAQSCSSGQSGQGKPSAQQMLQSMIPRQQDVMQQTQQMMQMQMAEEALRQQRQAQLDRLAGEQRSLQEIAKQIQETMKNDRQGLGKLDRAIDEMEAVAKSLERGNLSDDLVNQQQRILSRMLDAERSVHTRDYEKERQSVTADEIFSRTLGRRPEGADAQTLRDEIQRAMQLKAPGEYEDLIRMYFRALADESPADGGARSR